MFKKLFVIAAVFMVLTETTLALGFGDITVFSKLNEPLKAHIELLDSKSMPVDEVTVKNASISIYRRANLPKPEAFNKVRFKTTKLSNGSIIVVLTTKHPIKEPFITFIADLRWRTGHLNREYTFLLDPPELVLKNTKTVKKTVNVSTKSPSFSKKSRKIKSKIDHSAVIAAHVNNETYKTKQADSLWDIAKRLKPDNRVTTYQTMQALFALNPDAFINGNIDLLKQNRILKVPSVNEILQINGKTPIPKSSLSSAKPLTPPQTVLNKQKSAKPTEEPANTQEGQISDTKKNSALPAEARLKIIPPTQELLNRPVTNKEDLKLIKKALKTSIDTIQLLHNENDSLEAKINELTEKLNDLDSDNDKLNSQITEISSLLKNNQLSTLTASKQNNENVSDTTLTSKPLTQAEEPVSVEIKSDVGKIIKSPSFVRELLTSPFITFALAIFTILILVAILFTIRKQNEKRKQRKNNAYLSSSDNDPVEPTPEKNSVINNNISNSVTDTETLADENSVSTNEKIEDEMDFFEYFEKKINAPDEPSDVNSNNKITSKPTKSADSENNTEVNFSLDITDEEIQDYERHITQSYQQSKKNVSDSAISEIDTYMAYGNYKTAEEIILKEIKNAPDNKNLHLKLFECYSLNNKRYEYMQHIKAITNILNVDMVLRHRVETIYQQTWNETLNINKFT